MRLLPAASLLLLLAALPACHSYTGNGAVAGAAFGAGSGALFAHALGESAGGGALLGAGLGALAGAMFGQGLDHASRSGPYAVVGPPAPFACPVVPRPPVVVVQRGYWVHTGRSWVWVE